MSNKLLASLVAALSLGTFADNSVYVAKNGSDFSGDGSSNNPYASLAAAVSALGDEGGAVEGYAFPSVDLAGLPRLNRAIDVGCYEKQPVAGMKIRVR